MLQSTNKMIDCVRLSDSHILVKLIIEGVRCYLIWLYEWSGNYAIALIVGVVSWWLFYRRPGDRTIWSQAPSSIFTCQRLFGSERYRSRWWTRPIWYRVVDRSDVTEGPESPRTSPSAVSLRRFYDILYLRIEAWNELIDSVWTRS